MICITDLAIILKNLRNERGLSQMQVAQSLKISQPTYSHYENGDREPDIQMLIDLANFYRVSIDILVGRYKIDNSAPCDKKSV